MRENETRHEGYKSHPTYDVTGVGRANPLTEAPTKHTIQVLTLCIQEDFLCKHDIFKKSEDTDRGY